MKLPSRMLCWFLCLCLLCAAPFTSTASETSNAVSDTVREWLADVLARMPQDPQWYTAESWAAYLAVRDETQAVYNDPDATQEEFMASGRALMDASTTLSQENRATEEIQTALREELLKLPVEDYLYSETSWAAYMTQWHTAHAMCYYKGGTQLHHEAVLAALQQSYAALERDLLGDVDEDGIITSTDARLTLQYYANKIGAGDLNPPVADVDGDETFTSTDARLILQYYAGKITEFPTPPEERVFQIVATNDRGALEKDWTVNGRPAYCADNGRQLYVYENGQPTAHQVTWSSNNAEGIYVDETGYVADFKFGKEAMVTATLDNGLIVTQAFYTHGLGALIEEPVVQSVNISCGGNTWCDNLFVLLKDKTELPLTASVYYGGFDYPGTILWESSDPTVASVDENGLVTLHEPGRVLIRATAEQVSDYFYLNIV